MATIRSVKPVRLPLPAAQEILAIVMQPRGNLSTRRMTAHRVVLGAAALTTLVAAAIGAALAVFVGQGLPLAIRHDLSVAPGTALSIAGPVSNDQTAATARTLRMAVGRSLGGVPFGFWSATWSDPLDLVPGSLPARPAGASRRNTPLLEAASLAGITGHAVLVSGQWPAATAASQVRRAHKGRGPPVSGEIPAALPASAAALLHLSPGDVLTLEDKIGNARISFRITGLFAPRRQSGGAASYWALDTIPASGSSSQSGYTEYGPLVVSPAAFGPAAGSTGSVTAGTLSPLTGSWLAQPDMEKFTDTNLPAISDRVSALQQALLTSAVLSGMQLSTSLPSVLSATASNLSVARSLLVISALQLLVLALAALLAVARLLASEREAETALISARGADRWQLARLTAAEVIPLCAAAAAVGALAGIWLAGLLTTAGPMRAAGVQLPGPAFLLGGSGTGRPAGTWADAIAAALTVTVVAAAAMLGPVLGTGPAMTEARVRRGRQAAIAGATRAGADLALVLLAVLAGWQLRRYSAGSGDATIDPVLALAPALALAGGTVVTLRLLPAVARAGDRFAGRGRRLSASLAGWQVSRQPLRQGGAALLLVMAVATGTLALAQHASWSRSASDQGSFDAGADARVDTPSALTPGATGAITSAAGVRHAMPVYVQLAATPTEVLAIGAAQAPGTVRIRPDQASVPAATLFGEITPKTQPGAQIAGRPDAITFTTALTLAGRTGRAGGILPARAGRAGAVARTHGPVAVTATVADSTGDMYQLDAGTLPADGREHVLVASLGGADVSYPLRLVQIALTYQLPPAQAAPLVLTVTGPALSGWHASTTSPDLQDIQSMTAANGASALPASGTWAAKGDSAAFTFSSGFGQAANPGGPPQSVSAQVTLNAASGRKLAPLPAIATAAFADANNIGTGSVVQATFNGLQVPLSIVAVVRSFPTVTDNTGALIVDLPAVQQRLVVLGTQPLGVTEWWLATTDHQIPPGLAGTLPPGSATTGAAAATTALTGNPLSAAPQQALLALAIAAALLAITGFWVSIAANLRQRRAETALLAALGVSQRSVALQLCLEKLMLSVPSAVLGVVLGTVVARLLVPAVTLSPAATQPSPPPVTLFDLPQALPLAAAIAVIPALATALIMIRRPDPAAELRATEAA
jgi:ABC-type antimicrobial peptide transport system permease subunit